MYMNDFDVLLLRGIPKTISDNIFDILSNTKSQLVKYLNDNDYRVSSQGCTEWLRRYDCPIEIPRSDFAVKKWLREQGVVVNLYSTNHIEMYWETMGLRLKELFFNY